MNRLFDKVPEDLFSPLSRKYKTIYAFSLVSLYYMLRVYKTDIRKTDYVQFLRSQGEEILELFSVETDLLDEIEFAIEDFVGSVVTEHLDDETH